MRFAGGVVGITALVVGGVGVGFHVDAGARTARWGEGLRQPLGAVRLGLASLAVTF